MPTPKHRKAWVEAATRQVEAREDALMRYIKSDFSDSDTFAFLVGRVDRAHAELARAKAALSDATHAE